MTNDICSSCKSETKPDEWSNYEEKLCIDCKQEDDNEVNEDYAQRKIY